MKQLPAGEGRRKTAYEKVKKTESVEQPTSLTQSVIERDVIARGVFTLVPDLKRKLMRYIRHYNTQPKPVKWKYFDAPRRITPESIVTTH